jgi:hypothetical protein
MPRGHQSWTLDATRNGYVAADAGTHLIVYGFDATGISGMQSAFPL